LFLQAVADEAKFFEAAQTLAQGLSQWSLLIVAGSLVIIVSTSYYRPRGPPSTGSLFPVHSRLVMPGDIDQRGNTSAALLRCVPGWLAPGRESTALNPNCGDHGFSYAQPNPIASIALSFVGLWLLIYVDLVGRLGQARR
jgi:hypothetical protein